MSKAPTATGTVDPAATLSATKSSVPYSFRQSAMPRMKPRSPMRFVMKAFFEAAAAKSLSK